jgi:hypothetical protein
MNLRVREFPDRGFLLWFALVAGVVAWAAHLLLFASIVEFIHDNGYFWIFHVGNWVCIALALLAFFLSWLVYRGGEGASEEDPTPTGRMRFLGTLGMAFNGINLLLIITEGSYIYFISTGHGRGA